MAAASDPPKAAAARALARALRTTKARAVLSVHSSSLVNNFVLVTKSEANDGRDDVDALLSDGRVVSKAMVDEPLLLLSLVLSIVSFYLTNCFFYRRHPSLSNQDAITTQLRCSFSTQLTEDFTPASKT